MAAVPELNRRPVERPTNAAHFVLECRRFGSTDAAEDPAVQDRSHRGVVLRADVRPRSLQVVGDALAVAIEHGFAP
jgi:hypothetical protein